MTSLQPVAVTNISPSGMTLSFRLGNTAMIALLTPLSFLKGMKLRLERRRLMRSYPNINAFELEAVESPMLVIGLPR